MPVTPRRGRPSWSLLLVAAVVAASCASPFSAAPADPALTGRRIPKAQAAARAGGTLRVAIDQPSSLDPADLDGTDNGADTAVRLLCDTLLAVDPVTGGLQPGLVATWRVDTPETAPLITLTLRRGARFADGSEVTAGDVAASLTRIVKAGRPAASSIRSIAGTQFLTGGAPPGVRIPLNADKELLGVQVLQRDQLTIALEAVDGPGIQPIGAAGARQLLLALTDPALSPVPERIIDTAAGRLRTQPDCAGPYRLAAPWTPADRLISLERNPGYHGRHGAYTRGGSGWADRIELHVIAQRADQVAALRRGEVDVAFPLPEQAADAGSAGRLVAATAPQVEYLAFGRSDQRFAEPQVRRALSLAVDRRAVAAAYGPGSEPATHLPSPGILVADPGPCAGAPVEPDEPAARAALGDAAALGPVTLTFNDEYGHRAAMEQVAQAWRTRLGLAVDLVPLPWNEYVDRISGAFALSGERLELAGPFRAGWLAVQPSAASVIDAVLGPSGRLASEGSNVAAYEDPALDRALQQAAKASGPEAVAAAERRLLDLVCGSLPVIPLVHRGRLILLSPTVASAVDLVAARPTGTPLLRELYLTGATP